MSAARAKPTVVLAAGGTGGHMFPAQALARELLAQGARPILVTDRRGGGFGPELAGQVETHHISAAGFTGGDFLAKITSTLRLGVGYLQAWRILARLKPTCVVGFGGYASLPTLLAAGHMKRRIVLHEQNAVMGRANRMLTARAEAIALSFPEVAGLRDADREKAVLVGNPVRPAIAAVGRRPYSVASQGGALRLLVTGGSQGARVFNDIVPQAVAELPEALRRRLHISQQVRGTDIGAVEDAYKPTGVRHELQSFFDDMPERLQAAHLVICRAGASTITELAASGRPAILVPYPYAADDHQTANARAFAEAGGGWLMPQSSLDAQSLAQRLTDLLEAPALLTRAADCARNFGQSDSARRLADLVSKGSGGAAPDGRKEAAA